MSIPQLTEQIDNLYTTTWQQVKDTVADNIFDATPFWFWLKNKGKLKTTVGGRFLTEPLEYAKSDTVKWIGKGGTVELNEYEFLTEAMYDWRYLVDSIVRFGVDEQKNSGKWQIMELMKKKMTNVENGLIDTLETALFQGQGSVSSGIDGLQHLVQDNPTVSSTVGSIPQDTYTWWRNQYKDMTGSSFASNGRKEMVTMNNNCGQNRTRDMPDIIVTTQEIYEYYESLMDEKLRLTDNTLGDVGFENVKFKGKPIVWAPSCPAQKMYFLNTRYLYFKYDPRFFFAMTDWKAIPNQVNDRAAQILTAGALITNRRRVHGVIHSIDTA